MCMSTVIASVHQNDEGQLIGKGYKAFVLRGEELLDWNLRQTNYHFNHWYKSKRIAIKDYNPIKRYTAGFHIMTTVVDVTKYLAIHGPGPQHHGLYRWVILPVQYKNILSVGMEQNLFCITADEMQILDTETYSEFGLKL